MLPNLSPFKLWTLQNFPFIEADFDAITNYELMSKIVEYLNKNIDTINNQTTVITNLNTNFNTLNTNFNTLKTNFNTLKTYVDSYFQNLDVQDEINNKLDQMATSGQLTNIIAQYLQLAGILVYNTINDLKNAENITNGSICRTLGSLTYNDGYGNYYKIRPITSNDVIDNNNILALIINSTLIAEKIPNKYIEDITNNFNNKLDNFITPQEFGAIADGTTDDSQAFQACVDYAILHQKVVYIGGNYLVNIPVQLDDNICLSMIGYQNGNTYEPNLIDGKVSKIKLGGSSLFSGSNYYSANSTMPVINVTFKGINVYSDSVATSIETQNCIFNLFNLSGSLIKDCSTLNVGLIHGKITHASVIRDNKFLNLYNFIRAYSWGSESMSDSLIDGNYISSGLHDGICFASPIGNSMRISNNYIDYFKYVYEIAMNGGTIISSNNIYDGIFRFIGKDTISGYPVFSQFTSNNDKFNWLAISDAITKGWLTVDTIINGCIKLDPNNYISHIKFNNPIMYIKEDGNYFIQGGITATGLNNDIIINNPQFCDNQSGYFYKNMDKVIKVTVNTTDYESKVFTRNYINYNTDSIEVYSELPAVLDTIHSYLQIPVYYKCRFGAKIYQCRLNSSNVPAWIEI